MFVYWFISAAERLQRRRTDRCIFVANETDTKMTKSRIELNAGGIQSQVHRSFEEEKDAPLVYPGLNRSRTRCPCTARLPMRERTRKGGDAGSWHLAAYHGSIYHAPAVDSFRVD